MAQYLRALCRAVLRGLTAQLNADVRLQDSYCGIQVANDDRDVEEQLYGPAHGHPVMHTDDLAGRVLRDDLVNVARATGLGFLCSSSVCAQYQ